MLIDIFGRVNLESKPETGFAFRDLPYYRDWKKPEKQYDTELSVINGLYKKEPGADEFYDQPEVQVHIFGYCFTRSASTFFHQKKRLAAAAIAALYLERGMRLTNEIKGSYVIVILDKRKRQLHLVSDPLNIRQVYYQKQDQELTFSSSLNALVKYRQNNNQLVQPNLKSLVNFHLFDYILDDSTMVEDIQVLPEGAILTVDAGGCTLNKYFDPFTEFIPEAEFSESESLDLLENILGYNINLYLDQADDTAIALTGGYDSRLNLAFLNGNARDYSYYSYGKQGSYDLEIPAEICRNLDLDYHPYYINQEYEKRYPGFADQAVFFGDGIAEISKANYVYPFCEMAEGTDHILTGLFGSELVKQPTSNGLFIDKNTRKLLSASSLDQSLDEIFAEAYWRNYLDQDLLKSYEADIRQDIKRNPYFVNDYDLPERYFYFILMQGTRKYFMKEIKIERPYIENLHPFFDLEFIQTLIKTPFAWVNNFSLDKNLVKSLKNHRFYTRLFSRLNPKLASIISTHAYYPKYLNNVLTYPLLALQYKYYKNKFSKKNKRTFSHNHLYQDYFRKHRRQFEGYEKIFNQDVIGDQFEGDVKTASRLTAIQRWYHFNNLKLS